MSLATNERSLKSLLVTGGAGFIGSAFIRHVLDKENHFQGRVINFDALTYAGNLENLKEIALDPRYTFVKGDIRDQALLLETIDAYEIDTIIHFAAESHVDRSITGPEAFIQTNIIGTFQLLEAVKKRPHIHFHHVSTDEVFGSLGKEGFFTEKTPYDPQSPYSASKASSDHLVRAYHNTYKISACISNCSNNYGPYHFPEKLIPLIILNALQDKPLPVYGKGEQIRDWLFVEDHAKALFLLLQKGVSGETYNIGGRAEKTNISVVYAILKALHEQTGKDVLSLTSLITFVKDRPGHDFRYAIDCSKIEKECGFTPSVSFEEGISKTVAWYLNNEEWVSHVQDGSYQEWVDLNYAER